MLTTRILDDRLLKLQRQGRIGFVGLATGQEAAIHGMAAAFGADDWIFGAALAMKMRKQPSACAAYILNTRAFEGDARISSPIGAGGGHGRLCA
ncbi:MAG: hypothetical protein HQ519_06130 [Planctomycetes bacterium]|nr:hypothetical protein [Planctomycetota bacterium]